MRVLESHVPEWKMVCWENPFERTDKKLKEYDLSSNATWQVDIIYPKICEFSELLDPVISICSGSREVVSLIWDHT